MDAGGTLLMEVPFAEILDRDHKPVAPHSMARFRNGQVEIERTSELIRDLDEKYAALHATLAETRRVLALPRQTKRT